MIQLTPLPEVQKRLLTPEQLSKYLQIPKERAREMRERNDRNSAGQ